MASKGYITTLLNKLDDAVKVVLIPAFTHVLDNLRFGRIQNKTRAENFQMYYFISTTATTANSEFSIAHAQGQTPRTLIPVVPLDDTNAQVVRLKVTTKADANRVYLSSPDTNAVFYVGLEF